MQISQVYFNDTNSAPPSALIDSIQSVKNHFYDFPYVLYDIETARFFLQHNFGSEITSAFDKLNPYAYKADLFRYCVMYLIGGWYFDITLRLVARIVIPDNINTVAFRDYPGVTNSSWSITNGAIFSKPKHPVYEKAINLVLENCANEYYGTCNLCPTGPVLLGRAFAFFGDHPANVFYNHIQLTPSYTKKNHALVLADGSIFAYLKHFTSLTQFGCVGTNSYAELYSSRNVYK